MMSNCMFETDRLFVRHFNFGDLDAFAALCGDPRVMKYVGDGNPLPRTEVERWIGVCRRKYADRGYGTSAVMEKDRGRFVGYCGVIRAPRNDFDELVYAYRVDSWGKGYATEAGRAMIDYVFAHSYLDRIYATIDPDHTASIKVAEKLGFNFERRASDEDGMPVNYYFTERREWNGGIRPNGLI